MIAYDSYNSLSETLASGNAELRIDLDRFSAFMRDCDPNRYLATDFGIVPNRDLVYFGLDDILAHHGRSFSVVARHGFRQREPKRCYENAGWLAVDHGLTYVEGYVRVCGVPVPHAWAVYPHGEIVEVTLRNFDCVDAYIGVPIRADYLCDALIANDGFGVFCWKATAKAIMLGEHTPDMFVSTDLSAS